MGCNWRSVVLGELVDYCGKGITPKYTYEIYSESAVPVIGQKCIRDYVINSGLVRYHDKEKKSYRAEKLVQPGDILINSTGVGTAGRVAQVPNSFKEECLTDSHVLTLRTSKIDPLYLGYVIKSMQSKIELMAEGSTGQTELNKSRLLSEILVSFPEGPEQQRKIANFFQIIDEKISINNRINDYLSEIASALFSHEILESIDDTWLRASLLDIASYKNGLAMQKYRPEKDDPGLPVLKIKELAQGQCAADAERCRSGIDESVKVFDGDLIFSWSGTLLLDFWAGGNAGLNQHLFKVTSKKYKQWFYYFWTNYHMRKFITLAKDRATTMGHIKRSALAESEVYIPNENKMNELDKLFDPLIKKIISLKIESRILSELRNELLPKLMSGEIDVCKVGVLVERL